MQVRFAWVAFHHEGSYQKELGEPGIQRDEVYGGEEREDSMGHHGSPEIGMMLWEKKVVL